MTTNSNDVPEWFKEQNPDLFHGENKTDKLKEMTQKLVDYHNKIVDAVDNEETISDELASEISNYLSNEVPPLLLNADKLDAFACVSAMCKWFPTPFLCNVLTALVLYMFSKRINDLPTTENNDEE